MEKKNKLKDIITEPDLCIFILQANDVKLGRGICWTKWHHSLPLERLQNTALWYVSLNAAASQIRIRGKLLKHIYVDDNANT